MKVHLRLNGTWAECHATQRPCPRVLHLADTDLTAAHALPSDFIEQLFDAIDLPTYQDEQGNRAWYDNGDERTGRLHREHGLPAEISAGQNARLWYIRGSLHRIGGPAVVRDPTNKAAVAPLYASNVVAGSGGFHAVRGTQEWYRQGLLHRTDGPALINEVTGLQEWYRAGKLHRTDGPARIEQNGQSGYFFQGEQLSDLRAVRRQMLMVAELRHLERQGYDLDMGRYVW